MATFNPSKDAYIIQDATTTNDGAGDTIDVFKSVGSDRKALLTFDLSSLGAITVASGITLDLFHVANTGADFNASLSRVTQAWVETEVTWNVYSTGNNWATAGGDFTTSGEVTGISIPAGSTADLQISGAALQALAQDAIDNRAGILDVILRPVGLSSGTKMFGSLDNATAGLRPLLTIEEAATNASRRTRAGYRSRQR